jgi:hypothetical protein
MEISSGILKFIAAAALYMLYIWMSLVAKNAVGRSLL